MKCPICKGVMVEEDLDYVVKLADGRELRLEEVPTWVCERCDYTEVDEAVIATVEDLLEHMETFEGQDGDSETSVDDGEISGVESETSGVKSETSEVEENL